MDTGQKVARRESFERTASLQEQLAAVVKGRRDGTIPFAEAIPRAAELRSKILADRSERRAERAKRQQYAEDQRLKEIEFDKWSQERLKELAVERYIAAALAGVSSGT